MRLILKKEATKPAGANFLQQQAKFDRFIDVYNQERPHRTLNMEYPAECYRSSPRHYTGLPELEYPLHDRTITGPQCGLSFCDHQSGRVKCAPNPFTAKVSTICPV